MSNFFGSRSDECPDGCEYNDSYNKDKQFETAKKWFRNIYLKHLVTQQEIAAAGAPAVINSKVKYDESTQYKVCKDYFHDGNYIAYIISLYNLSFSYPSVNSLQFVTIHKEHTVSILSKWRQPFEDSQINEFETNLEKHKKLLEEEPRELTKVETDSDAYRIGITDNGLKMITKYDEEKSKALKLEGIRDIKYTKQIKSYLINNILDIVRQITEYRSRGEEKNSARQRKDDELRAMESELEAAQTESDKLEDIDTVKLIRKADEAKARLNQLKQNKQDKTRRRGGKSRRKNLEKTKSRKRKAMKRRR